MGLTQHLPNAISLLRILMTPLVIMGIRSGYYDRALVLAFIAAWTDAFDGWAARHFRVESSVGKVLDPLADKVLQVGVFLALGMEGVVPVWLVSVVFGRDLLILAFAAIFLLTGRHKRFEPTLWGKVSTILQLAAVVLVLARAGAPLEPLALSLTAVATVFSGFHYGWRALEWMDLRIAKKP